MSDLIVIGLPNSYLSSIGAVIDAHARMAEMFTTNRALGDYASLHTGLKLLTPDGRKVVLAGGRAMTCEGGLDHGDGAAMIYLPDTQESDPDLDAATPPDERLDPWLRSRAAAGVLICACGGGIWRAARAGLLDGRRASVEARQAAAFRRSFPRVRVDTQHPTTTTGPVMTCASGLWEPDFIIRAIDRAVSPGAALWLAVRRGGPAAEGLDVSRDPLVARAQLMIRERFTEDLRVAEIAEALSISHQTLIRRFRESLGKTPRAYVQLQRLNAAAATLRETTRSVTEVAALVGYADPPSFRAAFQAHFGTSPSGYRKARTRSATRDG